MKYNKFFIAITLCMSISTNISYSADTFARLSTHAGRLFKNIPTSMFNTINSWSTNKILMVVGLGLTALLASGAFSRKELKNFTNKQIDQPAGNSQERNDHFLVPARSPEARALHFIKIILNNENLEWYVHFNKLSDHELYQMLLPNIHQDALWSDDTALEAIKKMIADILKRYPLSEDQIKELKDTFRSDREKYDLLLEALGETTPKQEEQ
ncbi:MAG: hypothetical protein ABI892_00155 [Flavobacterium sp.]